MTDTDEITRLRAGEEGVMEYSIELWQDGQKVAAVHSDSASNALWAIAGYAAQYEQDGPVTLKVKNRKKPAPGKEEA